ncbi:hypothetical protein P3T36_007735 [Kitasatospora sp. MAP12-15]|uniref:hypothetical protein n=1 Tax=unclassified Kitasatospora TaxID=2633591 RepID=UPI0024762D94|nr:hypothetical protein [Kitasatospora sp. MAP12-44]MDH6115601.1 hypothetical protein [Kitasatospora sp. MAP12-44]
MSDPPAIEPLLEELRSICTRAAGQLAASMPSTTATVSHRSTPNYLPWAHISLMRQGSDVESVDTGLTIRRSPAGFLAEMDIATVDGRYVADPICIEVPELNAAAAHLIAQRVEGMIQEKLAGIKVLLLRERLVRAVGPTVANSKAVTTTGTASS